jgi:glutathione S-transferase
VRSYTTTSSPRSTHRSIPDACALVRLQADHVNRNLVPAFYRFLQAQDPAAQIEGGREFHTALEGLASLLERTEKECTDGDFKSVGLWHERGELGWTDVMAGPCEYSFILYLMNWYLYLGITVCLRVI